jgi:hypothetical protein
MRRMIARKIFFKPCKISLDLALGEHYNVVMMNDKTKAPQIADNNLKGRSHTIARMSCDNAIVSQSPKKGKAQNDVLQLQYPM